MNIFLCWCGCVGHPHLMSQHLGRSPVLPGTKERPGTARGGGRQMLASFGVGFFRPEQALGSVPKCCCGQGRLPWLDAGGCDVTHAAVLLTEPARCRFRFPLAACGSLGREEKVFILYLFIGREGRETPQPSCAMQEGQELHSLVSESEEGNCLSRHNP